MGHGESAGRVLGEPSFTSCHRHLHWGSPEAPLPPSSAKTPTPPFCPTACEPRGSNRLSRGSCPSADHRCGHSAALVGARGVKEVKARGDEGDLPHCSVPPVMASAHPPQIPSQTRPGVRLLLASRCSPRPGSAGEGTRGAAAGQGSQPPSLPGDGGQPLPGAGGAAESRGVSALLGHGSGRMETS